MSNKLFVGGLAWATDDHSLRSAFEPFGVVSEANVVADRETGRSRGFGFVTFDDVEAAKKAISAMDGQQLDGRTIRVNAAAERAPRGPGGGGGGGGFGGGGPRGGGGRGGRGGPRGGGGGGRGGRGDRGGRGGDREEW